MLQDAKDSAFVPTTNLSKTRHASWLSNVGSMKMLNLYNASILDLANALLQCAKILAFVEGKYKGIQPSIETLLRQVES